MASITAYTAERMKAIEDASIVSGQVVGDNLILTRFNQTTINAGNVRGATGLTGPTGDVSLSQLNTAVPAGSITMYAFSAVPSGWLAVEGQSITNGQTLYPALWAVAPASWKSGSTLILPDMRGRIPVGFAPDDESFDTLWKVGGSKDAVAVAHTHTVSSHTHALPDHNHTVSQFTEAAHQHNFTGTTGTTSTNSDLVTRLSTPVNGGFTTGRYMNPWDAAGTNALMAGNTGFGTSNSYTGMSVGFESPHTHSFTGLTEQNSSPQTHLHVVNGGGSGSTQVITNQVGGTSTTAQSPSASGTNANLQPYITVRFIIRAY